MSDQREFMPLLNEYTKTLLALQKSIFEAAYWRGLSFELKGGEVMVCPLVVLEARLEHKMKALEKHMHICQELKKDIFKIQDEKKYTYFELMNGKGVY